MFAINQALLKDLARIRENGWCLAELRQQLASALGLIPFVGAGMSRDLGYPLWSEFLIQASGGGEVEDRVRSLLARMQYEEAAEAIAEMRHPRRLEDAVRQAFGTVTGDPARGPHAMVPYLTRGPVLTTNFDRVLERAFEEGDSPFEKIVPGDKTTATSKALITNQRVLVKLHGDWEEPETRVLTLSDYRRAYGGTEPTSIDRTRSLPRLLQMVMQNRPLLFLGCSLGADRTLGILRAVAEAWPELSHYAILPLPSVESEIRKRDNQLADWGIRPIWYPTGKHECVGEILASLATSVHTGIGTASSGPHETKSTIQDIPLDDMMRKPVSGWRGRIRRLIDDRS